MANNNNDFITSTDYVNITVTGESETTTTEVYTGNSILANEASTFVPREFNIADEDFHVLANKDLVGEPLLDGIWPGDYNVEEETEEEQQEQEPQEEEKTASDIALDPTALTFDLTSDANAKTITITTSGTGEITATGNNSEQFTVAIENKTITVTPVAVTGEAVTVTVSQAADDTYAAGTATFTVTVTNTNA